MWGRIIRILMKLNKRTTIHAVVCTIILAAVMLLFISLNYIDFSVVKIIYLPIYIIALAGILFRQYIIGYFLTASAGIGLIIEYIVRSSQAYPTMMGAFLNTFIIISGFVIGIIIQVITNKARGK